MKLFDFVNAMPIDLHSKLRFEQMFVNIDQFLVRKKMEKANVTIVLIFSSNNLNILKALGASTFEAIETENYICVVIFSSRAAFNTN